MPTRLIFAALLLAAPCLAVPPDAAPAKTTVRPLWNGGTIRLVEPGGDVGEPQPRLALPPGTWTVIIQRPDHRPVRGTVEVGERPLVLSAETSPLPDYATAEIWATLSMGIGLSMVATVGILQVAAVEESPELTGTQIGLAAAGSVGFIAGGLALRWLRVQANPPPTEGAFEVIVGAAPLRGGALVSAGAAF